MGFVIFFLDILKRKYDWKVDLIIDWRGGNTISPIR
jgi:hypothetical protein